MMQQKQQEPWIAMDLRQHCQQQRQRQLLSLSSASSYSTGSNSSRPSLTEYQVAQAALCSVHTQQTVMQCSCVKQLYSNIRGQSSCRIRPVQMTSQVHSSDGIGSVRSLIASVVVCG